ncbi:MAG TPA: gamma carbonic anhydrase family protein [Pirellulaceae bacterium]|nr:gamma carbonic anhydrase family protein [Pirellulaceae bacterium]
MSTRDQWRFRPEQISPSALLVPTAVVLGDVTIADEASVWFQAVIRGDTEQIRVGPRTNVQDLCLLHADPGYPCTLGEGVTLGHGAIVHGATIGDHCLIGMRAVVMNGASIGAGSIVGVGAVVTKGTVIPPGSLVLGMPGRVARAVEPRDLDRIRHAAEHYVAAAKEYRAAQTS